MSAHIQLQNNVKLTIQSTQMLRPEIIGMVIWSKFLFGLSLVNYHLRAMTGNLIIQAGISECDNLAILQCWLHWQGFPMRKYNYHYGCFPFTKHRHARYARVIFFMNLKLLEVATLTGLLTVMIRLIWQVCLVTNVQLSKKKKN